MSGRLKFFISFGFVIAISIVSVLLPLTTFAKTQVTFVIRFPWDFPKNQVIANITPIPKINEPSAIPTSIPPTPTPTPTPSPTPTNVPTPTPTSPPKVQQVIDIEEPAVSKQDSPSKNNTENIDSYLLEKMNEYRRQNGLSEIGSNQATCDFAQLRAREIESDFSHAGFRSRIDSNTLPYTNYSYVNENIAQNSDFTRVIDSWINSPGHAENMRQNLSTACIRHSGEFYVFEGWRG